MIDQALSKIGLTKGEIKVYKILLELGSSTTGALTKGSHISGSKVYEVLERLEQKGLVTEATINGVRHFEAANPSKLIDYLEEKERSIATEKSTIQDIIPSLLLNWKTSKKSEVKIFSGWEGLKTANEDIIQSLKKGDEWLSMGLSSQPKTWEIHFNNRQKERARKGIVIKHLINKKYSSLVESRKLLPHTQFRFLPESLEMPTSTEIYADKVMIMILSQEHPMAILIESKEVSASFRKFFEVMWKKGSKI